MPANDRVLERVRKLLAIAEHPTTPPAEAEAMSEKAAELMARHAIDSALVEVSCEHRSAPMRRDLQVLAPYTTPKSVLLSNVAAPYRVRTVMGPEFDGRRECSLIGFASDIDVVEMLFTSLLLQATTAMLHISAGQSRARAFRHAFLLGYADVIGRRIRAAQQRAEEETTGGSTSSAALVLFDRKSAVDQFVEELFPRLRSLRTSISDGGGLVAGQAAASRADLAASRRRVRGSPRPLPRDCA